jgi:hypothetical protein
LARALRWGKYPMSKIFWVLVNGDKGLSRYYAMEPLVTTHPRLFSF